MKLKIRVRYINYEAYFLDRQNEAESGDCNWIVHLSYTCNTPATRA
jgi:hypothetical protein